MVLPLGFPLGVSVRVEVLMLPSMLPMGFPLGVRVGLRLRGSPLEFGRTWIRQLSERIFETSLRGFSNQGRPDSATTRTGIQQPRTLNHKP